MQQYKKNVTTAHYFFSSKSRWAKNDTTPLHSLYIVVVANAFEMKNKLFPNMYIWAVSLLKCLGSENLLPTPSHHAFGCNPNILDNCLYFLYDGATSTLSWNPMISRLVLQKISKINYLHDCAHNTIKTKYCTYIYIVFYTQIQSYTSNCQVISQDLLYGPYPKFTRSFLWGQGMSSLPYWNVTSTGRLVDFRFRPSSVHRLLPGSTSLFPAVKSCRNGKHGTRLYYISTM